MGAWFWDEDHGFGLTFETDAAEARQSYYAVRDVVPMTLGATVFLFLVFMAGLWKSQSRALKLAEQTRDANEKLVKQAVEREKLTIHGADRLFP